MKRKAKTTKIGTKTTFFQYIRKTNCYNEISFKKGFELKNRQLPFNPGFVPKRRHSFTLGKRQPIQERPN